MNYMDNVRKKFYNISENNNNISLLFNFSNTIITLDLKKFLYNGNFCWNEIKAESFF